MAEKKAYPLTGPLTTGLRFAVVGTGDGFRNKKHAWKVWRTLKRFRAVVYPVARGLDRLEGSRVYSGLPALKDKADVAVICLLPGEYPDLVEQAKEAGIRYLWFQPQTYTKELGEKCRENDLAIVCSCVLQHRFYARPWAYLNPCYWHGKGCNKVKMKWS